MLVIQIFIMRNGAFEGTEMVTSDRIEIGRDPGTALQLDDESCSRRHAVIYEHDGKLAIQDLGSQNGTRVNGEAVVGARYIGPRDDITIGVFTLKLKVMSAQARAAPSVPPLVNEPTRVMDAPQVKAPQPTPAPLQAPRVSPPRAEAPVSHEARPTSVLQRPSSAGVPPPRMGDIGPTEHLPIGAHSDGDNKEHTHTAASPPPVPPVSEPPDEAPVPARSPQRGPQRGHPPVGLPDVTAPDGAQLPAHQVGRAGQARGEVGHHAPEPMLDFPIPEGVEVPTIEFGPQFLAEELLEPDDEDPPWSLVQRLVRPTSEKNKSALVEVVHYRGETVVDHTVLHEGETFRLGAGMSRAERKERKIPRVVPLVRLKKGGVAEVFIRDDVTGRLLRGGQQQDLTSTPGLKGQQAVPITDGELASLKVGNERVFVRFAGAPQLLWTREDAAEDLFARRLAGVSMGAAAGLFSLMAVVSWIYQYRNADSEVIALEDEGFAEVELKELKMEEPPPEEKPVEPIMADEPTPQPDQQNKTATKPDPNPKPTEPAPKPGVMDLLKNIPQVQDSASSQNLSAALSNIKGVRVPGATAGFKTSSLVGKGPSSGVQIGGAAGGLATSGINSVIRENGAAGAMGGKSDRAVSGKVTTLSRQFQKQGQGELSKEEVMRVINANIGKIQYCYEKSLRTQPGLSGRVVLEWTVNTSGKVTVVKVAQSSLNSNEATRCMMDSLRGWKFPQPKGGNVTIVFPFVFNTV